MLSFQTLCRKHTLSEREQSLHDALHWLKFFFGVIASVSDASMRKFCILLIRAGGFVVNSTNDIVCASLLCAATPRSR